MPKDRGPASAEEVVMTFIAHWNAGEIEAGQRYLAPDFERHGEGWPPVSREHYIFWWQGYSRAFPDAQWEVLDLAAGPETVAVRLVETGTFTHPWDLGARVVQPVGKPYRVTAVIFFKVRDRQIWRYDYLGYGSTEQSLTKVCGDIFGDPTATLPDAVQQNS